MLTNQTIEKLLKMRLNCMADTYSRLTEGDHTLSFDELFGMIVDNEWLNRQNKRLKRLLTQSDMRFNASIEDINYTLKRGLEKNTMLKLSECNWLVNNCNIILTGPTGTGKTYIACAIGNMACRQNYTVKYYRLPRLITDLVLSKAENTYNRCMKKIKDCNLLILDDFGLSPVTSDVGRELLEVIEDRVQKGSIIIAGQLPAENWHSLFADPTIADACIDRIVHNAIKIELSGDTVRGIMSKIDE
jgi:DNA replication protein DnaC